MAMLQALCPIHNKWWTKCLRCARLFHFQLNAQRKFIWFEMWSDARHIINSRIVMHFDSRMLMLMKIAAIRTYTHGHKPRHAAEMHRRAVFLSHNSFGRKNAEIAAFHLVVVFCFRTISNVNWMLCHVIRCVKWISNRWAQPICICHCRLNRLSAKFF